MLPKATVNSNQMQSMKQNQYKMSRFLIICELSPNISLKAKLNYFLLLPHSK